MDLFDPQKVSIGPSQETNWSIGLLEEASRTYEMNPVDLQIVQIPEKITVLLKRGPTVQLLFCVV